LINKLSYANKNGTILAPSSKTIPMFRNYLLTALRNAWRNKTYSFLNLFGLAIGVACAGLIFLWVESESGFDASYPKKAHIYRILTNQTYDGVVRTFDCSPGPLAPAIRAEIPEAAGTCRTAWANSVLFSLGDKNLYEKGIYADSSFFNMFSLPFLKGNPETALGELH